MKKRLMAALLIAGAVTAIAVVSLAGRAPGASAEVAPQTEIPPTMKQVQQAAVQVAAKSGEMAPTEIKETSGTLGQVSHLIDPNDVGMSIVDPRTGKQWSESAVDVVTERGQFTYDGPAPKDAPAPTGTVLTIVLDGKSGAIVAESLNNSVPELRQINANVTMLGG